MKKDRRAILMMSAGGLGMALASSAFANDFNVPSQPAQTGIPAFASQAKVQIIAPVSKLDGVKTQSVVGDYDTDTALKMLIAGTGLQIASDQDGKISLRLADAQAASAGATQSPPPAASSSDPAQVVVVTGTRIRGLKAPTGSNLETVSSDQIQALDAPTATELLAETVTQLPTFNTMPNGATGNANTVPRLGLRGFGNSAGNASGGTGTLILFNGHRVVFTGYLSSDVDPESIPADILDSVQVMPDGGSAAYGSDAVGGVINFVTKKRFDGVQLHVQTGMTNGYHENTDTVTAGKNWDGGSVVFSTNFANNSPLWNRDRAYTSVNYTAEGGADYRVTTCPYGSFTIGGIAYAAPSFSALPAQPKCEPGANSSMVPEQSRVSAFMYFEQKLTDTLKFSMDAFYSDRKAENFEDVNSIGSQTTINSSNPYFHSVAGETSQAVSYSYANAIGPDRMSPQEFRSWQVSPSLTWQVNSDWVAEADFVYGWSEAEIHDRSGINTAAVSAANLDPYDTSKMPASLIASVTNYENLSIGINKLASAQFSSNGSIFTLPGGDVKVAAGAEATQQNLDTSNAIGPIGTTPLIPDDDSRRIGAVYGEVYVPIIGRDNSLPLVKSLDLDVALRHDQYSDFGGTTNPRFGLNYRPIDDLLLRANYQTTFDAASLADSGLNINQLQVFTVASGIYKIYIAGPGANLKPTIGKDMSLGADWTPHFVPGLRLSITYWNDHLENIISQALAAYGGSAFASRTPYALCGVGYAQYSASAGGACTQSFVDNILATKGGNTLITSSAPGINSISDLFLPGNSIATLIDARRGNFGLEHINGLDFEGSYTWQTPIGEAFVDGGGTLMLQKMIAATKTSPFVDYLSGKTVNPQTPPLGLTGTVGLKRDTWSFRYNVTYNSSYNIPPGTVGQTKVGSFSLSNLSISDEIGGFSGLKSNIVDLDINNLFNVIPPWNSAQGTSGYPAAGTLGRMIRVGIRSKF